MTRSIIALIALVLFAWCNAPYSRYNPDRTPKMDKPSPKVDKLFAQTKPVCFGRFVIDVPATAEVAWGPTNAGYEIVSYPGQGHMIPLQIHDKVEEIKSVKHWEESSMLIGVFDGPNSDSKIVVGYESRHGIGLVQLHSYIRLGEHAFVQSAPGAVMGRDANGVVNKAGYQRWVAEMQDTARRLRVREESEIPAELGLCIEFGFVADGAVPDAEMTSIGFRFPGYPDVSFSIRTIKTDRPDESNSLDWSLQKGKEAAGLAGQALLYARIKTLRKGDRRIGDWEGAEILNRMPAPKDGAASVHEFLFKSIGVANDGLRPIVDVQLDTGVGRDKQGVNEPSLKDEDAVALWDKLTTSIRARPTLGRRAP